MSALSICVFNVQKEFMLSHGRGHKRAVDDISFSLQEGERVGFIGANGAGKTTLLQLLAGIADPTAGTLKIQGKVTAIFTLGMGLREDLSGMENIYVEGELLGRPRDETARLIGEIVAFAELGDFIDRPVRTYSTGMKARLAFSTIVHIDPEILIVDEALSVGDARFSAKATKKMKELTQRGRILILVSHSMAAIQGMCTRCIWLEEGRIKMDGAPAEVTKAYIDQSRKADDARLFERFRKDVLDESILAGWRIFAIRVLGGAHAELATSLVTGEPAALAMTVEGPPGKNFDARLHLRRLDGLVVLEAVATDGGLQGLMQPDGQAKIHVGLGELPLNFGTYLVRFDVIVEGQVAARRSTLFEVINPRPHKGGRPVLVYPSNLNVTRLSP